VRKRLVSFVLAPSASEPGDTFKSGPAFHEFLSTPRDLDHIESTQLQVGAKVFWNKPIAADPSNPDAKTTKFTSVGEVIHTDVTHNIGLAIISLEAIYNAEGNLSIVSIPKEPTPSHDPSAEQGGEEDQAHAALHSVTTVAQEMISRGEVGFITVLRPRFFEALDPKSGKMKEDPK
jgi:hypothetical protein